MRIKNAMHPSTMLIRDGDEYTELDTETLRSDRSSHSVSADPKQYSSAPSNFTVITTPGTVFTLDEGDKGFIQNLGTGTLKVKKGDGASVNSFSFVLKAGSVQDDGNGGYANINDWVGTVSVVAGNGGDVRFIAWKVTT